VNKKCVIVPQAYIKDLCSILSE